MCFHNNDPEKLISQRTPLFAEYTVNVKNTVTMYCYINYSNFPLPIEIKLHNSQHILSYIHV